MFTKKDDCFSNQHLFSLSLSTSEQSFFEEKFKYLIVTSSVFNETSQQQQDINTDEENNKIELLTKKSLMIRLLGVSISCGVMISYILSTASSPWLLFGLIPVYLVICYFIYKHHVSLNKTERPSEKEKAHLFLLRNMFRFDAYIQKHLTRCRK